MSNIHKIIADSLSDAEYALLQEFQTSPVEPTDTNEQLVAVLRNLRLIEPDPGSGGLKISALGNLVYYQRSTG